MLFDTALFTGILLAFVFGTAFSKWLQAFVAYRLGDRTPRQEGRLSLKLGQHHDILGILLSILLALGSNFCGWGKPLNLNGFNNRFKRGGVFLIGISGPLGYYLLAILGAVLLIALPGNSDVANHLRTLRANGGILTYGPTANFPLETLYWFVVGNAVLGAFQLLPIYPLDGYLIFFKGLLPVSWETKVLWMESYGVSLLFGLMFVLSFLRLSLITIMSSFTVVPFLSAFGLPFPRGFL